MSTHPVVVSVQPPRPMDRLPVVARWVVLIVVVAVLRAPVCLLAYLSLPIIAAVRVTQRGAERYLSADVSAVTALLEWLAGAFAWAFLLSDEWPGRPSSRPPSVEVTVQPCGSPSAAGALLRILYSLPAAFFGLLLCSVALVLWPIGALFVLVRGRVPTALHDFFALALRFQVRWLAYHLCAVDRYPSVEAEPGEAPHSRPA